VSLSAAKLRRALKYSPSTGKFWWKHCPRNTWMIGREAGCPVGRYGHLRICIDGRNYYAHRLAWLYHYGKWPKGKLDHKNNNPKDNRIKNLRLATRAQNRINAKVPINNGSGLKGVTVHAKGKYGSYTARIGVKGKRLHLGLFYSKHDAHLAYMKAARKYYGRYARAA